MAHNLLYSSSNDFYFTYYYSAGNLMTMNPDDLDLNVVGVYAMFLILADLKNTVPRTSASNLQSESKMGPKCDRITL